MDFYLGIDIGTSRVKAVLFDQHFTACASAAENTSPRLSANGYAEQDMTQLWHSVLAILRQIARHPALQAGRLRAIGLAGQGEGVWLSDDQGEPVGPGILWSDTRSHELMSDLLRRPGFDRRYFADTGTHLQPCNTSLQLYWLKQYQPARLAAARYLFFAKDWIRFRLTGVAALELTDASSSLLNQQTGSWSSVVMNEMGLNELLPLFPPLLAPDAPAGTLSDAVAALTGLPAATPVAAGALDVCSAALGCGAVNEGDIYTILGTTCCTGIVCRGPQTVNEATRFVTHTEAGQVISLFRCRPVCQTLTGCSSIFRWTPIWGAWSRRSRRWSQAAAASSGSRTSMANVRRFTARTRGPAFSALARTPPAPNCSARCLKAWPSPLSMRCRVIRRAASCI